MIDPHDVCGNVQGLSLSDIGDTGEVVRLASNEGTIQWGDGDTNRE